MKTKIQTMAELVECDVDQVDVATYDGNVFSCGSLEYLILTDEEADQVAEDYIKDSVWAFNPSFLASHTGIDEEIFEMLQDKCESSNEVITNSIKDMEEFIADAIGADGRGHFISSYDGEEEELNDFFVYRMN